jgi:lysophospholipase L1-like esterase
MKDHVLVLLLLGAFMAMSKAAEAPSSTTSSTLHPALFLVGDSTMQTGTGNGERGPSGWGSEFQAFFDSAKMHVYNEGRGGRSSRGYIEEGLWDKVLERVHPGDFVLLQFGHNDSANSRNYPDRISLKGIGDEVQQSESHTNQTIHTYGWYLRRYASDAKGKGATAIICSPVPRNSWTGGKIKRGFDGYAKWAAETAGKSGVLFLDLNTFAADRYDALGQSRATNYFVDSQHTSKAGARLNAEAVVDGLKHIDRPALKDSLLPASH